MLAANKNGKYDTLIQASLRKYGITVRSTALIRHNENITVEVNASEGHYVLRIHKPREGYALDILCSYADAYELFENEMKLLEYIACNSELTVQKPVKTLNGEYICCVDGCAAALLSWIDGENLTREKGEEYASSLGRLAADLHSAVSGFPHKRYIYSHELLVNMKSEMQRAEKAGHISKCHLSIIECSLANIDSIMTRLDSTPNACSLIHSDMNFGNILESKQGLSAIDFSLSGYGYRAMECGMLASCFQTDKAIEAMRSAYISESGIDVSSYDTYAFLALSIMLFISCQHSLCYKEEWFEGAMKRWTTGCLKPENW